MTQSFSRLLPDGKAMTLYSVQTLRPALATPLMIASGLFWLPWWALIGFALLWMARN